MFSIRTTNRSARRRGFTLIEVVTALGVFALVMLALVSAFLYAFKINASAANQTRAAYAAQAKMEETISNVYDAIPTGTIEVKERIDSDPTHYFYPFWRQTEVTYVDDNVNPNASETGMKRIDVTVFWNGALSGKEKTYVLTSLVSKR